MLKRGLYFVILSGLMISSAAMADDSFKWVSAKGKGLDVSCDGTICWPFGVEHKSRKLARQALESDLIQKCEADLGGQIESRDVVIASIRNDDHTFCTEGSSFFAGRVVGCRASVTVRCLLPAAPVAQVKPQPQQSAGYIVIGEDGHKYLIDQYNNATLVQDAPPVQLAPSGEEPQEGAGAAIR